MAMTGQPGEHPFGDGSVSEESTYKAPEGDLPDLGRAKVLGA